MTDEIGILLCKGWTSGVARTFGAHGQRTLRGHSPILRDLIPFTPIHPVRIFQRLYLKTDLIWNTAIFNQFISHKLYGVFWKFESLWWRDGWNGAPWWGNYKLGPLDNVIGNSRSQWEPLDEAMINWDLLITWWEIRGDHFEDMMRKLGALDGAMENFRPFDDTMAKMETLNKVLGKRSGGGLNDLIGKIGNWTLDGAMEHLEDFLMMQWAN